MTSMICPDCGASLSLHHGDAPCPVCLLAGALDLDAEPDELGEAQTLRQEGGNEGEPIAGYGMGQRLRYLGNYEILEEIGRGAMGVVFRARQVNLGREVAVKVLLGGLWASEQARQRFLVEARAAAALRHPAIVPIHEVGEHGGQLYFSMPWVEGVNLAQRINEGDIDADQAARWMVRIAEAVDVAHRAGVLHRDLKPSNVLLDRDEEPWVSDFGLAKILDADGPGGPTLTGQVLGTPGFIAPERLTGNDGPAGDIYSLGAILYALLVGEPPLQSSTPGGSLLLAMRTDPERPAERVSGIPADLDAICCQCLERQAADRYASAAELAADLQRFLDGHEVRARRLRPSQRLLRRLGRQRHRLIPAFAILIALLAVFGWGFSRWWHSPEVDWLGAEALTELANARDLRLRGERSEATAALGRAASLAKSSIDWPRLEARITDEAVATWQLPEARREAQFPAAVRAAFSSAGDRLALLRPRTDGLLDLEVRDLATGAILEAVTETRIETRDPLAPPPDASRVGTHPAVVTSPGILQVFSPVCGCLRKLRLPSRLIHNVGLVEWVFSPADSPATRAGVEGVVGWQGTGGGVFSFGPEGVRELPVSGRLLSVTPGGRLLHGRQHFWELDFTTLERVLPQPARKTWAVSLDGGLALLIDGDRPTLWDRERDAPLARLRWNSLEQGRVKLSPDGQLLVSLHGNELKLWNVGLTERGSLSVRVDGELDVAALESLVFSPTGRWMALAGSTRGQKVVWLLETTSGRQLATLLDQESPAFGPLPGQLLTIGGLGSVVGSKAGPGAPTPRTVESPLGEDSGRGSVLWHFVASTAHYRTSRGRGPDGSPGVHRLGFDPSGEIMLAERTTWRHGGSPTEWSLALYERNTGELATQKGRPAIDKAPPVALLDASENLWFAQAAIPPAAENRFLEAPPPRPGPSISIYPSPEEPAESPEPASHNAAPILPFDLTSSETVHDGRYFPRDVVLAGEPPRLWAVSERLSGSLDRSNPSDGAVERSSEHQKDADRSVPVAVLEVWDLQGEKEHRVLARHDSLNRIALSPDRRHLAVAGRMKSDGAEEPLGISLWNASDERLLRILPHGSSPSSLAWGAGGKILFTGHDDGSVQWTDLEDEETRRRQVTDAAITAIAHDADSHRLAVADREGRLQLIDLESESAPMVLMVPRSQRASPTDHGSNRITALAFHPEDATLFSGDSRGEIRVWPLATLQSLLDEVFRP